MWCSSWRITSRRLRHFRQFGQTRHNSTLPNATVNTNPRQRSKVFRSLLNVSDSSKEPLNELAARSYADIVILQSSDPNLKTALEGAIDIPIYIRTRNPEDISSILEQYHQKIEGLVAVVQCRSSNHFFLKKLDRLEEKFGLEHEYFSVMPTLDTRYSYNDWPVIAASSKRNVAAILEDNAPENNDIFPKPPSRIEIHTEAVLATRAAGIGNILGPDMNVSHYPYYRKVNERAKDNGFDGRVSLNFDQSVICHDVYKVSHADSEWMNAILSCFKGSVTTYQRSEQESRQLVGPPHIASAQLLKAKQENELQVDQKRKPQRDGVCIKMHPDVKPVIELGKRVESPLRCDSDVQRAVWEGSFWENTPLLRSDELARAMGFEERPLAFSLLQSLSAGLSVMRFTATEGLWHLGSYNSVQYRHVTAREELTSSYQVNEIRTSTKGEPILTSRHFLHNEAREIVFSFDKVTMWQKNKLNVPDGKIEENLQITEDIPLLRHLVERDYTNQKPRHQLQLYPGQIIRHEGVKQYSPSEARGLANAMRAVNLHHFNIRRFLPEDLVVFAMGGYTGAIALSSRDLGHVIYETWPCAINLNILNQTDHVRAINFVRKVKDIPENQDLEEVEVKTFSIKNMDDQTFQRVHIPEQILVNDKLRPAQVEKILASECPDLSFLITGFTVRNIIRVKAAQSA